MNFIERLPEFADRILATCDDGRTYYYADLLELAETLAHRIPQRSLVFFLANNNAGALLGYLALLRIDAIPAMLGTNVRPEQLAQLRTAYLPAFIWLPAELVGGLPDTNEVLRAHGYVLMATTKHTNFPIHCDLALLLTTSGSTGSPLFVRQSRRNIASNASAIASYLQITPDDCPITTLPMSYTYGLSIIHSHVLEGCPIALTSKTFFDRDFWNFFRSSGATSMGGVPYHYEMLNRIRFWRMQPLNLRTLTQAGGRMEPKLSQEFARHCNQNGIRYFTMYGQVEATARMAYLAPEEAIDKAGSIGRPIPGGTFWLEDENNQRIEQVDARGELVYQGENVTFGYACCHEDLARGDDNQGILRTGDIARRDADGYYYIVGRKKRFLKLFGNRVNLQDVETQLRELDHEVACCGQDDHLRVFATGISLDQAQLIKTKLAESLKIHPHAITIVQIAQLPRNEAGKLLYAELDSLNGKVMA